MTLKQLRELMEHRGLEGVQKIEELGGSTELARKLNLVVVGIAGECENMKCDLASVCLCRV